MVRFPIYQLLWVSKIGILLSEQQIAYLILTASGYTPPSQLAYKLSTVLMGILWINVKWQNFTPSGIKAPWTSCKKIMLQLV